MTYDLIVLGGGPAGYVAAIRAAQLGKKVACVEQERAGGTCLNWGCIPTKSLLKNAEVYHLMKHRAADFGLSFDNLRYDWAKVIGRSRRVSDRLAGGIEFLFRKNKVDYIRGQGSIQSATEVSVTAADRAPETLEAKHILVATGARSRAMPGLPFNGITVIGSREAMALDKQPESIVIIGAGAIGVEFAYFFHAFGTKVTLLEAQQRLLPVEDDDVSALLEKNFTKQGIRCLSGTKMTGVSQEGEGISLTVEGKANETITADLALVAIGIEPVLPKGKELAKDARGYIQTDERYQTSLPGVYAVGDVIGPPWLAHVASWEAIQCVEGLFAGATPRKVETFPGCTYCQPQVASVGLTERAVKEKGLAYKVGQFPFQASGKAQSVGETEGFVKLIFGEKHGELLGAHIVGSEATELIAEMGLALTLEATKDELEATIHAHPTLSEAIHEATGQAFGHAIHI